MSLRECEGMKYFETVNSVIWLIIGAKRHNLGVIWIGKDQNIHNEKLLMTYDFDLRFCKISRDNLGQS